MIREVLTDRRTLKHVFPASTAVSAGDLMWIDTSGGVANKASNRTDTGSTAGNQADFTPLFLGVSADQRLSTETTTGNDATRVIVSEGVFDCDCASATFEIGDLVGIARDSGNSINYNSQVVKVADRSLAIGQVLVRGTSITKVRCWLSAYQFGFFRPPAINDSAVYSANGAITLKQGTAFLTKAGVGVMTLASPTAGVDDGKVLRIMSSTAQAHTVTCTAGFNNGGTASDVATFGGAIGDGMVVVAYNGVWHVQVLRNVTLA